MGLVLVASGPAVAETGDDVNSKVWICKYSHTPEVGESAQTVNSVDFNEGRQVGSWGFEDRHSSTYVYGYSVGPDAVPKPDRVDDCPPYQPPDPVEIDPPARPTPLDPCGPGNIAFPTMTDTATLDWTLLDNGDLRVEPQPGYRFSGDEQVITFDLPADSGEQCVEEIDPPARPTPLDPCGPGNIAFPTMTDTATLDWTLLDNGDLRVEPQPGYRFSGDEQVITFDLPADSNVSCPGETPTKDPESGSVSEQRSSCVGGVESRSAPTTTTFTWNSQTAKFDATTSVGQWGPWQFVRGLTDQEFENLGCRPDQPQPVEILGSEQRISCAGVEKRESRQVTAFEWDSATRSYVKVVGDAVWSKWTKVRDLTNAEVREQGCVLGEETIVPKPKPEKSPTVKGVERTAPAAVPTAVAAGFGPATGSPMGTIATLLVGGGLLMLLAGGWIGLGRRESGAHEA